ncbi:HigA family addiction module antitoxin [Marinobacter persicus]|uniref:XRE family plasmid maintenance system antidote protein n=1 Tax=Marinobacter persicus TaxID=930118 RepID=A0A2S6G3R5_9GAMM|nr:HigA family addiction module antitoxin [Marinobacter persicus]KXS52418.1 MAG: XRE family transcriptional regulator [Marinobacter sp. T13-3]PPK50345.1 XRE family plasmid maintenance system antidote protein [Marinobacter persicus]PPK53193.1 XRE family plasmid maintenance system antidote protein [Marinobacter persicus]PPK56864.1 XRE family plasmid maintenance system antidote protein [Marinobacter persicus]
MTMHNPPHPGEFIRKVYLEPSGISSRQLASSLGVSPSTLSRLLKGTSGISPEMSLRLSKVLGRSPESWLAMQDGYDLWVARNTVNLDELRPLDFGAA